MHSIVYLFVLVPLVELWLLVLLADWVGLTGTIVIALGTGVVGGVLARSEGLKVWRAWRSALQEMRAPEAGLAEGLLILVGGVLLITPGVLTDLSGALCVIPPSRRWLGRRLTRRFAGAFVVSAATLDNGRRQPVQSTKSVLDTTGHIVDSSRE